MAKTIKELLAKTKKSGVKSSETSPVKLGTKPGVDLSPKAPADRDFIAKHKLEKFSDRVGNKSDVYSATNVKKALDDKKNERLRGNGDEQYEEVVDEAARGVKHLVHLTYDDPSGKGTASANAKLHAPSKEHAKRYAIADHVKRGYKNVKAVSARVIGEELDNSPKAQGVSYELYELGESRKELVDHLNDAIKAVGSHGTSNERIGSALNTVKDSAPSHITPHHPAHEFIQNALKAHHKGEPKTRIADHLFNADTALRTMKEETVNEERPNGQTVKIKDGGGMKEFHGKTGYIIGKEGKQYRVKLHSPVHVPGVGKVHDDLWDGNMLRTMKEEAIDELKTIGYHATKPGTVGRHAAEDKLCNHTPAGKTCPIHSTKPCPKKIKEEIENLTEEKLDLAQVQYHHDRIHHHIAMGAAHDAHPDSEEHRIASNRHGKARFQHFDAAMALIANPSRARDNAKRAASTSLEADGLSDNLKTKPLKEDVEQLDEKRGINLGKIGHHAERIDHHRKMIDFYDSDKPGSRNNKGIDAHVKASNAHKKALLAHVDNAKNAAELSNDAEGYSTMARPSLKEDAKKKSFAEFLVNEAATAIVTAVDVPERSPDKAVFKMSDEGKFEPTMHQGSAAAHKDAADHHEKEMYISNLMSRNHRHSGDSAASTLSKRKAEYHAEKIHHHHKEAILAENAVPSTYASISQDNAAGIPT